MIRGGGRLRGVLWLLLLPCCAAVAAESPALGGTADGGSSKVYRITGVVVSARDGAPIPHCRMTVTESGPAIVTQQMPLQPPRKLGRPGAPGGPPGEARGPQRRNEQDAAAGTEPGSVLTDNRGHFALTVPKAGMWRLTGEAHGYRSQAYDEHEEYWAGIVLTAAAPEIDLTFRMTPDGIIGGAVFDEAGEPVRNAQVVATQVIPPAPNFGGRTNGPVGNATTDDRGHYELSGLAPGEYKLKVTARPWYTSAAGGFGAPHLASSGTPAPDPSLDVVYPETWYPAATEEEEAETVTLGEGEERQADFHLTPVPSIHLRIPRTPPPATQTEDGPRGERPPMVMRTNSTGGFYGQTTITSSNGTEWDVGGLAPGTYEVRMPGENGPGERLAHVTLGGDARVVTLNAAESSTPVTVVVDGVEESAVRQISMIDEETGQAYSSMNGGRGPRRREGDEQSGAAAGRTISLPPGRYQVELNGATGLFLTGMSATGAKVVGRTVEIGGGSPKLTVHAAIGRCEISGVAAKDGKPASGALVLLVPAGYGRPENIAPVERDETNTDGSFILHGVIPGPYILVAIDHGWAVKWRDPAVLAQYLTRGTPLALEQRATVRKQIEAVSP